MRRGAGHGGHRVGHRPRRLRVRSGRLIDDDSPPRRGSSGVVEIAWTQANAVLSVYVNCLPCTRDVEAAALAWARAIDKTARAIAA